MRPGRPRSSSGRPYAVACTRSGPRPCARSRSSLTRYARRAGPTSSYTAAVVLSVQNSPSGPVRSARQPVCRYRGRVPLLPMSSLPSGCAASVVEPRVNPWASGAPASRPQGLLVQLCTPAARARGSPASTPAPSLPSPEQPDTATAADAISAATRARRNSASLDLRIPRPFVPESSLSGARTGGYRRTGRTGPVRPAPPPRGPTPVRACSPASRSHRRTRRPSAAAWPPRPAVPGAPGSGPA